MSPTFHDGQLLFYLPMNRAPKVGDVVLVQHDGSTIIKRVAMVPGDKYREVYVTQAHCWAVMNSPGVNKMVREGVTPCRIRTIPAGEVFITGDNAAVSLDSRSFGPVPIGSIRGVVEALS